MSNDARRTVIMEAMGSASMCWENVSGAGEFDSSQAAAIGEMLYQNLHHIGFPNAAPTFRESLQHLLNCHSLENGSDTPDFILAEYLVDCLTTFDKTIQARNKWHGPQRDTFGTGDAPTLQPTPPVAPVRPIP